MFDSVRRLVALDRSALTGTHAMPVCKLDDWFLVGSGRLQGTSLPGSVM